MTHAASAVVRRHTVVAANTEKAFAVFTARLGDFKPPEHNLLAAPIAETVFEPRVGGHIYDRATDGTQCHWARVLVYEPPRRVVFSWDIGPTWQLENDPEHASEVEVRFIEETADRTRVELENTGTIPPPRSRVAGRRRRRRPRPRLAAVPRAVRSPVRREQLSAPPNSVSTEAERSTDVCLGPYVRRGASRYAGSALPSAPAPRKCPCRPAARPGRVRNRRADPCARRCHRDNRGRARPRFDRSGGGLWHFGTRLTGWARGGV